MQQGKSHSDFHKQGGPSSLAQSGSHRTGIDHPESTDLNGPASLASPYPKCAASIPSAAMSIPALPPAGRSQEKRPGQTLKVLAPEKSWRLSKFATGHAALDREQLQAFGLAAQELGADAFGDNVVRQRGAVEQWL
jgi:hypothetical protein